MIRFTCACGHVLEKREEETGQKTRCLRCGRDLTIPEPSALLSPESSPAAARAQQPSHPQSPAGRAPGRRPDMSRKAIASILLAVPSLLCSFLTAIPGIILGILSLRDIDRSAGQRTGRVVAIAGIAGCALGLLLSIPIDIGWYRAVRSSAASAASQRNLQALALALHLYHDDERSFPPPIIYSKDGRPLYSWRVALLPYLNAALLHQEFHLDEPWDSPHNLPLLSRMPRIFAYPDAPANCFTTHYQVFVGKDALFRPLLPGQSAEHVYGPTMFQILDGPANTVLIAEAAEAVAWTQPTDLPYDRAGPLPKLGVSERGFNVALCDASVRFIGAGANEQVLHNLIMPNDGNIIDWSALPNR